MRYGRLRVERPLGYRISVMLEHSYNTANGREIDFFGFFLIAQRVIGPL